MKNILKIVLLIFISILLMLIFNKKVNTPSNIVPFEKLPPNQNAESICGFEAVDYFECDFLIQNANFPFIRQKGKMYISKPNNMLIKNSSLEIGLNKDYFWFWSKHFNPKNLYYCKASDLENSRLKKSLSPIIFKKILTLNPNDDEFKIGNENFKLATNTEKIKEKTIIVKKIYKNNDLAIEVFVEEFQVKDEKSFPKKIRINWLEEDLASIWILSNITLDNKKEWKIEENNINKIDISN